MFKKSKRIAELEAELAVLRNSIEESNAYWRAAVGRDLQKSWETKLALEDTVRGLLTLIDDFDRMVEVARSSVDQGGYLLFGTACSILKASERDIFEAFPYEHHQGLFDGMSQTELLGYLELAVLGTKVADRVISFRMQNVYELDKELPAYLDYRVELERRSRRKLSGYDWMIEDEAVERDGDA